MLSQVIPDSIDNIPFGASIIENSTFFKVFSSVAESISLHLFKSYGGKVEHEIQLNSYGNGLWGIQLEKNLVHWLYGYKVKHDSSNPKKVVLTNELIADPWSKHVVTRNHYLQFPLSYILGDDKFDWEGDTFLTPEDLRDLVIYETHVKDLTASDSSWSFSKGSFKSLIDPTSQGGINHLKELGVNAVEFLPIQKFAQIEPSYLEATAEGSVNTWNFYGKNYWGYMTSFYFCPETSFASTASSTLYDIIGKDLNAHKELKEVIKKFHKEKISVIIDVVYNHVSNYDLNPLKFLDKEHYFRLDANKNFISQSGCGNDFKTESPISRQLIIESLSYWMNEFHIDGFRFDLASLFDWETVDLIQAELKKINPHVILIAEPWSLANYAPSEFGYRGWTAWNDRFRNGIKGVEPAHRLGFIFGHKNDLSNKESVENYLVGSLTNRVNGLFPESTRSLNYLESHDGYTLADFIRLSVNPDKGLKPVKNRKEFIKLNETELRLSKLSALILMISQGIPMIHAGQEYGRSKIIAQSPVNDPKAGFVDHDSYNKDNETNYLLFNEVHLNKDLFNFYKGLIEFRLGHPSFRKANPNDVHFFNTNNEFVIGFEIKPSHISSKTYQIWLNFQPNNAIELKFEKSWNLVIDENEVHKDLKIQIKDYTLKPSSGIVLSD